MRQRRNILRKTNPLHIARTHHRTHSRTDRTDAPSHLHDAPPAMALALIVLAIGSVLAGYVGVPRALGGQQRAWRVARSRRSGALGHDACRSSRSATAGEPGGAGEAGGGEGLELSLMVVSSIVAHRRHRPRRVHLAEAARDCRHGRARRFPACYRLLLNKYYVDEIYDAAIVQPIRIVSQEGAVARCRRPRDRRRGQRRGVDRRRRVVAAAAAADRIGARLRGLAVHRRRADPRLLPVEMMNRDPPLLSISWLLPLAGAVLLLLIGNADGRRNGLIRWVTLVVSIAVVRRHAGDLGVVRRRDRPSFSSSSGTRGFPRSASTTTSASTASACCWSS